MEIVLKLSLDETNLVLEGLGELQAKKSLGLIYKVKEQATSQINSVEKDSVPVLVEQE